MADLFDGVLVDEVVVVLVECAVQGDAVRLEEQVLQGVHALQAQALLDTVWGEETRRRRRGGGGGGGGGEEEKESPTW